MSDLKIELLPWQKTVWADETRFHVVAAGRRTGKSRLAAYRLIVEALQSERGHVFYVCLLYTSPSPRDGLLSRMPSSA